MKQSIKSLNISCLTDFSDALRNQNADNDFELLFVTAAGTILAEIEYGLDDKATLEDYVKKSSKDHFNLNAVNYLKHEIIEMYKSRDEVAGDTYNLIGDGSLIVLKNVRFYRSLDQAPYMSLNSFALHAADVIGFSLIPKESPEEIPAEIPIGIPKEI